MAAKKPTTKSTIKSSSKKLSIKSLDDLRAGALTQTETTGSGGKTTSGTEFDYVQFKSGSAARSR